MTTEAPTPSPDVKALAVDLADKLAIGEYVLDRDAGLKIINQALLQHGAATAQAMREAAAKVAGIAQTEEWIEQFGARTAECAKAIGEEIRALPLPSQTGDEK